MGDKIRIKLRGFSPIIPKTINFSELEQKLNINNNPSRKMVYGDEGLFIEKMEEDFNFEQLIVQMLCSIEGDERIIFLYQLLRELGYQIDHGSFAKTLKINRQKYMEILADVRVKTYLLVRGKDLIESESSKQTNNL